VGKLVDQIKKIAWVWFLDKLQVFWSNPCNARVIYLVKIETKHYC